MFAVPGGWSDGSASAGPANDSLLAQMDPEDAHAFTRLIQRYGPFNLMFSLRQIGEQEQSKFAGK